MLTDVQLYGFLGWSMLYSSQRVGCLCFKIKHRSILNTLLSSILCSLQLPPRHLSNVQTHSVAQHSQEPFSNDCAGRSAGGNTLSGFLHASNIISTGFICSYTLTCPDVINVDPKHKRPRETGSIWN